MPDPNDVAAAFGEFAPNVAPGQTVRTTDGQQFIVVDVSEGWAVLRQHHDIAGANLTAMNVEELFFVEGL